MEAVGGAETTEAILPFPLQNALTRPLRNAAARPGRAEFLSLWAGQGLRLARRQSAADLVGRLAREADATARRLADLASPPAQRLTKRLPAIQ
jgi:nitronate monooxygenase